METYHVRSTLYREKGRAEFAQNEVKADYFKAEGGSVVFYRQVKVENSYRGNKIVGEALLAVPSSYIVEKL